MSRKTILIGLVLASFALLIPGISSPILTIKLNIAASGSGLNLDVPVLEETRSILGTIEALFDQQRYLVGFLILLFSVIVPAVKGLMLLVSATSKNQSLNLRLWSIVNSIGKWSMADVFVVAVFLAYLSTVGTDDTMTYNLSIFAMKMPIQIANNMNSHLESGFYFFLGYCLLSLTSLHFYKFSFEHQKPQI